MRVQVTTEDFIFCQVRNMEHVVRVKMVEAQKAAGHKVDRLVVISVSSHGWD